MTTASGLLRRRLHADLSGPDVSRRRLSGVLRAPRHGRRRGAVRARRSPARRRCSTARTMRLRRRDLRRLHAAHHRADGRRRDRASTPAAREIYREWAACQHFELYDDVPAVLRRAGGRRHPHRPDLEHAPLPRVVPVAFRAAGADQRDASPRPITADEAASRASSRRRCSCSTCRRGEAVMVGDSLKHDIEGALASACARCC